MKHRRQNRLPKDEPFSGHASSRFRIDRDHEGEFITIFRLNSSYERRPFPNDHIPFFDHRDALRESQKRSAEDAELQRNPFRHLQSGPSEIGYNLSALCNFLEIWKKNGENITGALRAKIVLMEAGAEEDSPHKIYLLGPVIEISNGSTRRLNLTL